jgi:hypothetical protein
LYTDVLHDIHPPTHFPHHLPASAGINLNVMIHQPSVPGIHSFA